VLAGCNLSLVKHKQERHTLDTKQYHPWRLATHKAVMCFDGTALL
jgi:hypothetical protein